MARTEGQHHQRTQQQQAGRTQGDPQGALTGFAGLQGQLRGLAAPAQLGGFGATARVFVTRLQAQHHGVALAIRLCARSVLARCSSWYASA